MKFFIPILFVIQAFAQQAIIVSNAASQNFGSAPPSSIAPGSLVTIALNIQGGPITPIDASTVSIQLQPAGSVKILGTSGPIGVLGLLSDDAPLGPATLTLSFNQQTSAPVNINIVPVSFGLFTRNNGIGPVMAQNTLTHSPKPGDFVTIWGTGLGQSTDTPTVLLGGHPVVPSYAGPAPGLPGTDQINFQIPADPAIPNGCYVALAVNAGGYTSNTGMLSISPDGGPCASPFGFTSDQLAQLDAGRTVALGQVNLYNMLGPPPPIQWFNISGFTRMESAAAMFMELGDVGLSQWAQPLVADDVASHCSARAGLAGAFLSISQILNAGDKITLSTPGSSLDLTGIFYSAQLPQPATVASPDQVQPPFFTPGDWQISVPGGAAISPFNGQFTVPPPVHITNATDLASIDPTHDLTVNWNGTDYSNAYTATVQLSTPDSTLLCTAPASAGQLTIPAALLRPVGLATLELLLVPAPDHLTILHDNAIPIMVRYYPSEVIPVSVSENSPE